MRWKQINLNLNLSIKHIHIEIGNCLFQQCPMQACNLDANFDIHDYAHEITYISPYYILLHKHTRMRK